MEKISVLIVDDSTAVRNGLLSILRAFPDIEPVGEAINGLDAIGKVESLQPNVVLMDAQMPEMDGMEATRRIKETYPGIKILFLSVHADYLDSALAAGADGYLPKDSDRQTLVGKIRDLGAPDRPSA